MGHTQKKKTKQAGEAKREDREVFPLCWLKSDRGANRVARNDGPTGECRLCPLSGTNAAREGMQLPALEEGYCATGQGSLTPSQDGGLKGRERGTQGRERQPC